MEKWWIYTGLAFFVVGTIVLLIMVTQRLRPSSVKKTNETEEGEDAYDLKKMAGKVWGVISNPAVFLAIGIAILNWLVWALHKDFWNSFHDNTSRFWAINLAIWFALILLFVKPDYKPVARKVSLAICVLLILILGSEVWGFQERGDLSPKQWEKKQAEEKVRQRVFEEIPVLRAVYAHNKTDRHFEVKDGKVEAINVYKTRGLIQWQETMEKWELAINPGVSDMIPFILAIVEAPAGGGWSQKIKIPKIRGTWTDWKTHSPDCELMAEGDEELIFPCEDTPFEERVEYIQFRSTGEKPLQVEVFVRR